MKIKELSISFRQYPSSAQISPYYIQRERKEESTWFKRDYITKYIYMCSISSCNIREWGRCEWKARDREKEELFPRVVFSILKLFIYSCLPACDCVTTTDWMCCCSIQIFEIRENLSGEKNNRKFIIPTLLRPSSQIKSGHSKIYIHYRRLCIILICNSKGWQKSRTK